MEKKYKLGEHPHSKANLTYHEGRPLLYSEPKKNRTLCLTEEGWGELKLLAKELGYSSVSEFVEKIARRQVKISA
jgi:hypothetical protein